MFDALVFENFGIKLQTQERKWFAIEGKELKGSIEKGRTRGEAVVQAIEHETLQPQSQTYYSGNKESEVVAVRQLLKDNGLCAEKISFDALHCKPKTLVPIATADGIYLVGLKGNQKKMLAQVQAETGRPAWIYETGGLEKGHGRIQYRKYQVADIESLDRATRWMDCEIRTAIKVSRERYSIKSGKKSQETSYYLSNQRADLAELCVAVRNHWSVETNNHIRDVTLREDKLRSKKRI